ncbi:MAG: hypothetical protein ACJAUQ_001223 [Maribacter sp.]|jgi:hypothetical protein
MGILLEFWSRIIKSEWLLATEDERRETLAFIQTRLKSTQSDRYSKIWKTATGEAIGILGAYKIEDKRYE